LNTLCTRETIGNPDEARRTLLDFRAALTRGEVRDAEKVDGRWIGNAWVKQGILLGFRSANYRKCRMVTYSPLSIRTPFPARRLTLADRIRLVRRIFHPRGSLRCARRSSACRLCLSTSAPTVDEGSMID